MILLILPIGLRCEANAQPDAPPQEYAIGKKLGTCLARGCIIFLGRIDATSRPEPEAGVDPARAMTFVRVDLTVTDWLYGKPEEASAKTTVVKTMKPSLTKLSEGPWSVWENVDLKLGGQLLIARWKPTAERAHWTNGPEDLALVLSDMSLLSRVRQITAKHTELLQEPESVKKAIQQFHTDGNAMLAGYLATYIFERDRVLNADRAAILLSELMKSSLVRDPDRREIVDWIESDFYRLSDPTRAALSQTLFAMATSKERGTFETAIFAILRLQTTQMLVPSHLGPTEKQQLLENCRRLVDEGKAPAGLGARLTNGDTR